MERIKEEIERGKKNELDIFYQNNLSVIGKEGKTGIYCQHMPSIGSKATTAGITLVALVVTIVVDLVSYDKNRKYSNLVGFSL